MKAFITQQPLPPLSAHVLHPVAIYALITLIISTQFLVETQFFGQLSNFCKISVSFPEVQTKQLITAKRTYVNM